MKKFHIISIIVCVAMLFTSCDKQPNLLGGGGCYNLNSVCYAFSLNYKDDEGHDLIQNLLDDDFIKSDEIKVVYSFADFDKYLSAFEKHNCHIPDFTSAPLGWDTIGNYSYLNIVCNIEELFADKKDQITYNISSQKIFGDTIGHKIITHWEFDGSTPCLSYLEFNGKSFYPKTININNHTSIQVVEIII